MTNQTAVKEGCNDENCRSIDGLIDFEFGPMDRLLRKRAYLNLLALFQNLIVGDECFFAREEQFNEMYEAYERLEALIERAEILDTDEVGEIFYDDGESTERIAA